MHDVLIAGGGLAGQCLARQLKLAAPQLSTVVVDYEKRPLPEAAFKVGEATSELGAHYFAVKLGLKDYLEREHLFKNGLRFFFGDSSLPLDRRPEYGPRKFPPVSSYQLDRGRLENHLRDLNQADGVELREGFGVQEIALGQNGAPHVTTIRERQGEQTTTLTSKWVVDCSGRQRILQKKLGLGRPSPIHHSACWFRLRGKCDIDDFVTDNPAWTARVPGRLRHRSTTHLSGRGYWVWFIPLSSENTSVGIVVDERIHPIATLDTHEKAMAWLKFHEPFAAKATAPFSVMDFLFFRDFSYDTSQFYSFERWACVGEAAAFLDPFYSPGSDFIGMGNTMVTKLITRDFANSLQREHVEQSDATMRLLQRAFTEVFRDQLPTFGRGRVMTAKLVWDNASYWVFVCQAIFQDIFFNDESLARYFQLFEKFYQLNLRVQQLFRDWTELSRDTRGYEYLGYEDFAIAVRSHVELAKQKSPRRVLEWLEVNLDTFTAWGLVLFQLAVEDVAPELGRTITEGQLSLETLDLRRLEMLKNAPKRERNPLAREIVSLKRQMAKLFPEYACLHPEASGALPRKPIVTPTEIA